MNLGTPGDVCEGAACGVDAPVSPQVDAALVDAPVGMPRDAGAAPDGPLDTSADMRDAPADTTIDGRSNVSPDAAPDLSPDVAPDVAPPPPPASCRALHMQSPLLPTGVYTIDPDGAGGAAAFSAYCEMFEAGGGWTLLVKTNGFLPTFAYDSPLWTNDALVNATALDRFVGDAKLAGFASVPFTELRVGLQSTADPSTLRWAELSVAAPSLRELFAGPMVVAQPPVGRAGWLALLAGSAIQPFCDLEGINLVGGDSRLRVGIMGNNEMDCNLPDSFVGLGGVSHPAVCGYRATTSTTGNVMTCGPPENAFVDRAAFGFLMVR